MTVPGSWVEAVVAAGAVPASHIPEASLGRGDVEEFIGADPVEGGELRVEPLSDARPLAPAAVCFLDGIEQWRVVGYGGITPIVRAHVAAAVRQRGPDRRLRTVAEATEDVALPRLDRLPAGVRRALGVVKSHGAQYFEGAELERALTLPDGHRTSVFRPRARGARRDIYSWYVRLWPWEGNDLLYGLLRLEARAHPETIALASPIAAWMRAERAPVATPDRRWDRL